MTLAFIDRAPTAAELEQFRLMLSTFQDGSGMLAKANGLTLPGWRDFERTVAAAFNGISQENKFIFDVLIPDPLSSRVYGISCKMRSEFDRVRRDNRVTIELSNSSRKFKDALTAMEILSSHYQSRADAVGVGIIDLVEKWKYEVETAAPDLNVDKSGYLVLLYNKKGDYQLFWFTIRLPDPRQIRWYYPEIVQKDGSTRVAAHLNGDDEHGGRIFEWYSESGGQLKYYPLADNALWQSEPFRLEPLSDEAAQFELSKKAASYFPEKWNRLNSRV